jgi:hypothetical protein
MTISESMVEIKLFYSLVTPISKDVWSHDTYEPFTVEKIPSGVVS